MNKTLSILALIGCFLSSTAFADDEKHANNWLGQFLSSDMLKAESHLSFQSENKFSIEETIDIEFIFSTSVYNKIHTITHSENWDLLTKDGTENPPKIQRLYPHSSITAWTNKFGVGEHVETYAKELDNWLVFNNLSKILSAYSKSHFDDAVNALFYEDEIKWLKKQYKGNQMSTAKMWRQFTFDNKGNLTGLSSTYLTKHNIVVESPGKIELTNEAGQKMTFEPLSSNVKNIVSGVEIKSGEHSMFVYNRDLNFSLHKFCSDLFPNPEKIEEEFLLAIHSASKKGFERFDALAENE
ncbi:MAG: hypothetical protein BM555_05110 [Crocinitomix sp. MedPE-SWsnd]|nr:MAG: hypothetical protein BM555_05110 [Crocinitomix sp. MedPE-SWsnd]